MRRITSVIAFVGAALISPLLTATPAFASAVPVTIGASSVDLSSGESNAHTMTFTMTNATDKAIDLTVAAASADKGCQVTAAPASLAKSASTSVTVTVPATCVLSKGAFAVNVSLSAEGTTESFVVTGSGAAPKVDWTLLDWFIWAALGSFAVVLLTYLVWALIGKDKGFFKTLIEPLTKQAATWSFKDSWAANTTVVATLLAGIFASSDVLKTALGTAPDDELALALVAGAIAAGLVAAALLVLGAATRDNHNTVGGVLLAAVVTLTATGGQLAVLVAAGKKLPFGGYQHALPVVGWLGAALLGVYAFRTLPQILDAGLNVRHARRKKTISKIRVLQKDTANVSLNDDAFITKLDAGNAPIHDSAVRSLML